jgi:hypothetical protein
MMPEIAGLLEVGSMERRADGEWHARSCDICGETPAHSLRCEDPTIYLDPVARLNVCEDCVQGYLEGDDA